MNEPSLYRRANTAQRHDAEKVVDKFSDLLHLRTDGKDSLMDIGCGSGDVLMDFIVPILPKTFSTVIGTDISPRMIDYCSKAYADDDKVKFKVLDIGTEKMPLEFHEQFDHVTSFYCLHWVQNQRQALKNIYNMLFHDGDCLLVFAASSPWFDTFHTLAKNPKWSEYMKDVDRFIPPLQKHPEPSLVYTKLLKEEGFVDQYVKIRHKVAVYEGYECLKENLTSVCPFVERVPLDKREEFVKDMCEYSKKICLCEKMSHKDDYRYTVPYKLILVYARK